MRMLGVGDQLESAHHVDEPRRRGGRAGKQSLLKQALKQMSLEDAKRILTGGDDAATQYFKQATYTPLKAKFAPIIGRTTEKVKLGETYDALAKKAVALGVLKPEDATLQSYVTERLSTDYF